MNKLNYIIFIFLFVFFNCKKNKKKNNDTLNFPIKIENIKIINNTIYAKCLIFNHSNQKLYFPVDYESIKFINDIQKKTNVNAFYAFFYKNQDTIYANSSYRVYTNYIESKSYDSINKLNNKIISRLDLPLKKQRFLNWGIIYQKIKQKGFYIEPNSSKAISLKINFDNNLEKIIIIYDISNYNKKNLVNSKMQILLKIDSTEIKELLLLPQDLDSLKNNNIKIFNGELKSNKIPLFIE